MRTKDELTNIEPILDGYGRPLDPESLDRLRHIIVSRQCRFAIRRPWAKGELEDFIKGIDRTYLEIPDAQATAHYDASWNLVNPIKEGE